MVSLITGRMNLIYANFFKQLCEMFHDHVSIISFMKEGI